MRTLMCAMNKDFKELLRAKKNVYFSITLLMIGAMVLTITKFFPALIQALSDKSPGMISDVSSLNSMMANLFPSDVKGSLGIWASDVGVFYGIVVILMTYGLVTNEIHDEKWILPVASGHRKRILLISKCLVYGLGAAFPVFIFSNLYYFAAASLLDNNVLFIDVIAVSVVLSLSIASIVILTILSSVFYKHSITAGLSMIFMVMVAPDILTMFSFGKYMPTYLLTYAYSMSSDMSELIVPITELVVIVIIIFVFSDKKISVMEMSN